MNLQRRWSVMAAVLVVVGVGFAAWLVTVPETLDEAGTGAKVALALLLLAEVGTWLRRDPQDYEVRR